MASNKNTAKKIAGKATKKISTASLVLAIIFFLIGSFCGVGLSVFLTKNDRFELNGPKEVYLEEGALFTDEGVTIVSFGRDISDRVLVGGDTVDVSETGTYSIVYTVDDIRWGDYQLVRKVIVGDPVGGEDNGN